MQVVVIDDGIIAEKLSCPQRLVLNLVVRHTLEGEIVRKKEPEDFCPALHGTHCARILEHYIMETGLCEKDLELISLCIFEGIPLRTNCEKLKAALEWCLEYQIPIIHMSVGTRELSDYEVLYQVTARLIRQGTIIVAAGNNAGTYTMPACLGGVLGVAVGRDLIGASYHYQDFQNGICLAASAIHPDVGEIFLPEGISEGLQMGAAERANSYAAPTVTSAVYQFLIGKKDASPIGLFQALVPGECYQALHPDFIDRAVLLNLSGVELVEDCLFFQVVSDNKGEMGDLGCLVLLPGEDMQRNQEVVVDFVKKRENFGLLYAGRFQELFLEETLKKTMLAELLCWSEEDCGSARWTFEEESTELPPCIWIRTGKKEGIRLISRLCKQFREQGYQCVAVSNWEYAYLYGLEYVPPDAHGNSVLSYLKKVYTPDLILFLEQEGKETGIQQLLREEEIYRVKEEEFEKKELYREIIQYFS